MFSRRNSSKQDHKSVGISGSSATGSLLASAARPLSQPGTHSHVTNIELHYTVDHHDGSQQSTHHVINASNSQSTVPTASSQSRPSQFTNKLLNNESSAVGINCKSLSSSNSSYNDLLLPASNRNSDSIGSSSDIGNANLNASHHSSRPSSTPSSHPSLSVSPRNSQVINNILFHLFVRRILC